MANANISFDDKQNVFHLSNQQISYLIQIEEGGLLCSEVNKLDYFYSVT